MTQAAQEQPGGFATKEEVNQGNAGTWRKFRKNFQKNQIFYGIFFVVIVAVIGGAIFRTQPDWGDKDNLFSYLTNFATEGLGVLVTIFVVNEFQKRRDREQLKKELLADIRFGTNTDAVRAINRMRLYDEELGWYSGENSLLAGANLWRANLQGANLRYANLQGAYLKAANLEGANLRVANLQNTNLSTANLKNAKLWRANLKNAKLWRASLQGANLVQTNMQGSNLSDPKHGDARFSHETVLPNAKFTKRNFEGKAQYNIYYDPEKLEGWQQMKCYTEPDHPNYWNPCVELAEHSRNGRPWYCDEAEEATN